MANLHYWQAKIWGLLHDPALKALHDGSGRAAEGVWTSLALMQSWTSPKSDQANDYQKHIGDADLIASASDRAAIGHLPVAINYETIDRGLTLGTGLEITHLLSGEKIFWRLTNDEHAQLTQASNRKDYLRQREAAVIPSEIRQSQDGAKVFWWFWRCFPEAICRAFHDDSLMLMPAETRLPDGSIWSHASITSALAGALAGYERPQKTQPHIASFTFSPVQELIKASRKMRDFWAGSWILHYLSARICWQLAVKYGPDCLLYPSLYAQPLIDHWLLEKYPDFSNWITQPLPEKLLTAGFPNVIMVVLPEDRVKAAMQTAKQTLLEEWRKLAQTVFQHLQQERYWMPGLVENDPTWQGWLTHQWQHYWAAVPIGAPGQSLKDTTILKSPIAITEEPWVKAQNSFCHLSQEQWLFKDNELAFLRKSFWDEQAQQRRQYKPGVNVGSWWAAVVDQTRRVQAACKNARDWELPVAFGPRSTVSGIGPVVHPSHNRTPQQRWLTDGESHRYWSNRAGLFDGREKLNATETVKRVLHQVLPQLLTGVDEDEIAASYPDLTAGVAGYLKVYKRREQEHFEATCRAIQQRHPWVNSVLRKMRHKWGIPWADRQNQQFHPRLLNAGWLVEELDDVDDETRRQYQQEIQNILDKFYPSVNPANWYVLAAGDGDGMSDWLKGTKMRKYYDYLPNPLQRLADGQESQIGDVINQQELDDVKNTFAEFVKDEQLKKRMGPATHNALSRALLDFSNQLAPYLTEQRYAGRLIYGGGDDVLAYVNLWEWDKWLWDIRQCFRGDEDPGGEFTHRGNYWQWLRGEPPKGLSKRPLFTLGSQATISFGVVIAHHSVPLAIALENLWEAESQAKKHKDCTGKSKNAVQVRVLYANGNCLTATGKFEMFKTWQDLLEFNWGTYQLAAEQSALFEQAAQLWEQHPAPTEDAIADWVTLFCERREVWQGNTEAQAAFQEKLRTFLVNAWQLESKVPNDQKEKSNDLQNWLKLAAFHLRNRHVELGRGL
ncbi:MAG: type III-B CRISPR-associated protein Cas10/Cmr2 [Gloeomargarita sp. SKYG116]|nr:type III-B CRISPR-associated protein Cas10/Cmr2 [Gloeomargarita sp. SKYG116]MDW8400295.1 type III-B CRISPR-associated protein Cas10/Cmr2 [Gloeomargarita sp. SKYGB_i_bin116]